MPSIQHWPLYNIALYIILTSMPTWPLHNIDLYTSLTSTQPWPLHDLDRYTSQTEETAELENAISLTDQDQPAKIIIAEYEVMDLLGSGAFGSVYRCHKVGTGPTYLALKEVCYCSDLLEYRYMYLCFNYIYNMNHDLNQSFKKINN